MLEEVGVAYNTPAAMDVLEGTGAILDRERLTARLPRTLVERCLQTAPRTVLLAARDPAHDVWLGDGSLSFTTDGTVTYMLDDESGERHEGTAADLSTIMRLFDALPDLDYVWATISARDLDPLTANLEIAAISFRSCAKHVQTGVRGPEFVAPLLEMIAAVGGAPVAERPVFSAVNCTVAPLAHDGPMTEAGIALARAGVPIVILPMPLMGTTAPMTVAGATVVALAELLSAVVLFQLAAPGCPLIASPEPGAADLRSGFYVSTSPEAAAASLAGVEMAKQVYGLPTLGLGPGQRRQGVRLPGRYRGARGLGRAPGRRLARRAGMLRQRPDHQPGDASSCTTTPSASSESASARSPSTRPTASSTTSARWGPAATTWGGAARASAPATPGARPCCAAAASRPSRAARWSRTPCSGRASCSPPTRLSRCPRTSSGTSTRWWRRTGASPCTRPSLPMASLEVLTAYQRVQTDERTLHVPGHRGFRADGAARSSLRWR